jgi:hypothetical protein
LLLGVVGIVVQNPFGLVPIGGFDVAIHLVTGAVLAYFGFVPEVGRARVASSAVSRGGTNPLDPSFRYGPRVAPRPAGPDRQGRDRGGERAGERGSPIAPAAVCDADYRPSRGCIAFVPRSQCAVDFCRPTA